MGQWVPDEEARLEQYAREASEQKRKDELIRACRSRICTPEEMAEIEQQGIRLLLSIQGGMSQSYNEAELEKRLNELLLQQFRLRRAAESAND